MTTAPSGTWPARRKPIAARWYFGRDGEIGLAIPVRGRRRDVAAVVDFGEIQIGERGRRHLAGDDSLTCGGLPFGEEVGEVVVLLSEERQGDGDETRGGPDGDPLTHRGWGYPRTPRWPKELSRLSALGAGHVAGLEAGAAAGLVALRAADEHGGRPRR